MQLHYTVKPVTIIRLFCRKNIFMHGKRTKMIFTIIIIHQFFERIRSAQIAAQNLFYTEIFVQEFNSRKSELQYFRTAV